MRFGLTILLSLIFLQLQAQQRCATEMPTTGEFEAWLSSRMPEKRSRFAKTQATIYQIPVVVHVFHKGESIGSGSNLRDALIKAQIDSLTADFRRLNADAANTPPAFLPPVAADVEIEFVLAKQDPLGNPTDGIVRIQGEQSTYSAFSDRLKLRIESYWPPDDYFNVYVLDMQNFIGYASYPRISLPGNLANSEDARFDGVLVDYEYFGVNESASLFASYGRTLTHEAGHYFGLRHIWGDGGCSADDFVNDTPLADNSNSGYASPCTFPNPDDITVCVEGEPEMFQNYMDYTNDECMNLFTQGQKDRMRTVLLNAPNRLSLISSPGLNAPTRFARDLAAQKILLPNDGNCSNSAEPTLEVINVGTDLINAFEISLFINGVQEGPFRLVATNLVPFEKAVVIFPEINISQGDLLTFQVESVNSLPDENAANNAISATIIQTSSFDLPFVENFEGSPQVLGDFSGNDSWGLANAPKSSAVNQAAVLPFYDNSSLFGDNTIFKTPVFDLSGIPSGELRFSFAHAHPANAFYDGLLVKVSLDCGLTFPQTIFSLLGPNLATASDPGNAFTPANDLDWVDTLVSITNFQGIDGVQFAFIGLNGGGNNLYIDDVEVLQTNLNENDVSLLSVDVPILTCKNVTAPTIRARNVGSEIINSVSFSYGSESLPFIVEDLSVASKDYFEVTLPPLPLVEGNNTFMVQVNDVNAVDDESDLGNTVSFSVRRDDSSDDFPFQLRFEREHDWTILTEGTDSLWEQTTVNGNNLLKANGYQSEQIGQRDWFVSPVLSTGRLDTAGLYFRAAYAQRPGFTDRLQVVASLDCGESYPYQVLDIASDSLATTTSFSEWTPTGTIDWKEYRLDLSLLIPSRKDIRLAFRFISGAGNNLYIDDIEVRGNEPPSYTDAVRIFPNPATFSFNVGLNLPEKAPVTIRLLDLSGKLLYTTDVPNALNQIIQVDAPGRSGLYFIQVIGGEFKSTQKLFIQR